MAHFDANCMEIGFLLLKILRFYVFEMAAKGGRHFEMDIKTENFQTQLISQKHAYSYTFDKYDLCLYASNHYMVLFYDICTFSRHYWKKNNIYCESQTH